MSTMKYNILDRIKGLRSDIRHLAVELVDSHYGFTYDSHNEFTHHLLQDYERVEESLRCQAGELLNKYDYPTTRTFRVKPKIGDTIEYDGGTAEITGDSGEYFRIFTKTGSNLHFEWIHKALIGPDDVKNPD